METPFYNAFEQCWQFEPTAEFRRSRNIGGEKTARFRGLRTEGVKILITLVLGYKLHVSINPKTSLWKHAVRSCVVSSVNTARFVTARAIDLKRIPGSHDLTDQVSVRSDSENTKSAITPQQMIGSSSKGYMTRYPGFWFDLLLKVTEVKLHLTWSSSVSMARFVTAGAIDLKLCTYVRVTHRPNFGPVWFLAWPPGGQNWKQKVL
jgi:hypothetical protein